MNQSELVQALDQYFEVSRYNEHDGWLDFMTDVHRAAVQPFFVPEFWHGTWNGLMLDNTPEVDRVYLVVFPTAAILDTIIAKEVERAAPGAMIFSHHAASFDEREKGFIQILPEQFEELREHHISYYNCHAPLDCHPEISTSNALANGLGLNDLQRFGQYYGGLAGVMGTVPPISFQGFAERLAKACELSSLRYDQILHNAQPVNKVAIVAGGGGDPEFMNEAASLGADTYLTGHWHLFADSPYAIANREMMRTYIPSLKMNILGSSHYSSEMVVMRDQMKSWVLERFDLEAMLIRQENPWSVSG